MTTPSFQERLNELNTAHTALTEASFDEYKAKTIQFLDNYPYCYEYWKKLASAALQYRDMDEALLIYQQAIDTIPYCWQLWAGYIDFAKQCGATLAYSHAFTPAVITQLYRLALEEYVGEIYMSTTLWKDYLQFSVDQVLASNELDQEAVTTILDTYMYIFTGATKSDSSALGVILRASAITLLNLYEQHLNLIISKFPSIGNLNQLLLKAKNAFKECYSTDTATQRLSLYACIDKRSFYHHSSFKPELLSRFRALYRVLIDSLTTPNRSNWVSVEIQSILCICCDYADFWILYIRALAHNKMYEEALNICNTALSRCHSGSSNTILLALHIEKLQVLELQNDIPALDSHVVYLSNDFSKDPLIVLALAKYHYRKNNYDKCIDTIRHYIININCCNSITVLQSICRLLSASFFANLKKNAPDKVLEQTLSRLDDIYVDILKKSSLPRDGVKMLVVERMISAQTAREIGCPCYFTRVRDNIYHTYSEDADILEAALHTHIQWLQLHGQLAEIIEAEALLLRTFPSHLYSYVDIVAKSAPQDLYKK
ncbi:Hypothetical protein GLP15_3650 [Giardia lamblia P15]|uniref:Pre-mRNA-processing factor 39 n=1 Tax=Giardia intestinalis (strain P15) TaxID=658858 RepID=E1F699_GIAIA|nr:Hypothetical protein GLP15_3650 [Giardia lamblia P15]